MYSVVNTSSRENIHKEIIKLHGQGWGYTKIHKQLIKNGFEVGKSITCVDYVIKKRQEFLNQPIYKSGFQDFRIEVFER